MSAAAPHYRHTLAEYLSIEDESPIRHEFLNGEIVAMAGGTPEHAALAAAVVTLLGGQLRGKPCRIYSSDLRLRVPASGLATYADASIVCGEPSRDPASPTHVTNPTLVIEVLSPSTEAYDRGEKREHYQRITTLDTYLLIASERRRIELFRRQGDSWSHTVLEAPGVAELPAIGCTLSVQELYDVAGLP